MLCPNCESYVADGVRFCPSCGGRMPLSGFQPNANPATAPRQAMPAPAPVAAPPQPTATPRQSAAHRSNFPIAIAACAAVLLVATLGVAAIMLTSRTGVALSKENFPDRTFRNYLAENVDTDGDGTLSTKEINVVHTIKLKGVNNLKGINVFVNLENLTVRGKKLKSVRLVGLDDLKTLDLRGSKKLRHVAVSDVDNLDRVYLRNTRVKRLVMPCQPAERNVRIIHAPSYTNVVVREAPKSVQNITNIKKVINNNTTNNTFNFIDNHKEEGDTTIIKTGDVTYNDIDIYDIDANGQLIYSKTGVVVEPQPEKNDEGMFIEPETGRVIDPETGKFVRGDNNEIEVDKNYAAENTESDSTQDETDPLDEALKKMMGGEEPVDDESADGTEKTDDSDKNTDEVDENEDENAERVDDVNGDDTDTDESQQDGDDEEESDPFSFWFDEPATDETTTDEPATDDESTSDGNGSASDSSDPLSSWDETAEEPADNSSESNDDIFDIWDPEAQETTTVDTSDLTPADKEATMDYLQDDTEYVEDDIDTTYGTDEDGYWGDMNDTEDYGNATYDYEDTYAPSDTTYDAPSNTSDDSATTDSTSDETLAATNPTTGTTDTTASDSVTTTEEAKKKEEERKKKEEEAKKKAEEAKKRGETVDEDTDTDSEYEYDYNYDMYE